MIINRREIGLNQPPYIIAEMSANHNGSFDRAIEILQSAKQAGADCVKFQFYKANKIVHPTMNVMHHVKIKKEN